MTDRLRGLRGSLFAEFILIVVGVLLALWVDNWRERRSEGAREAELLRAVQADLVADSTFLARERESLPRQIRAGHAILRLDPNDLPPTDSLAALDAAFWILTPDGWSERAYTVMLESGELTSIRDPALLGTLTAYYENVLGRVKRRVEVDRRALAMSIEAFWAENEAYRMTDEDVEAMIDAADFSTLFGVDPDGYREALLHSRGLILFRMAQRIGFLGQFREVESARAELNAHIDAYLGR